MLRAWKITLPSAGRHTSRHRQHQFVPAITGAASCLEDRALLSGAAGSAHHAAAANLADTPAGRHVTAMFESVLNTAPTQRQLAQWVHKLHAGTSVTALHRHLVAEARTQASMQAAIAADPTVTVSPTGAVTVSGFNTGTVGTRVIGTISPSSTIGTVSPVRTTGAIGVAATLPTGLSNSVVGIFNGSLPMATVSSVGTPSVATGVIQMPTGVSFLPSTGSTGISLTATTSNGVPGTFGTTSTSSQANFLPTTTTGTATSIGTTTSPLGSLLTTGMVPTPGLATTTTGLTPVSTLTFTPTTFVNSTFNPSPLPLNGTLPFTGTPANPSPVPLNGTLPFTGTPANPSPVPTNGVLI